MVSALSDRPQAQLYGRLVCQVPTLASIIVTHTVPTVVTLLHYSIVSSGIAFVENEWEVEASLANKLIQKVLTSSHHPPAILWL